MPASSPVCAVRPGAALFNSTLSRTALALPRWGTAAALRSSRHRGSGGFCTAVGCAPLRLTLAVEVALEHLLQLVRGARHRLLERGRRV
jgi:hypothetical protein